MSRSLRLCLHGEPVARIQERTDAEGVRRYDFSYLPSYFERFEPPVLSLKLVDYRLDRIYRFGRRLPPMLTNLLPEREGALRRRIARAAEVDESDDIGLLRFVGQDLSGAMTVDLAETEPPVGRIVEVLEPPERVESQRLRWSLGGMQLKFSVDRTDRPTLALRGRGGRWILKIGSPSHPDLPRAELATMLWARHTGFEVPELEIVNPGDVEGLPPDAYGAHTEALLIRRFDRTEAHEPIHMEELAQVMGVHPEHKYCDSRDPRQSNLVDLSRLILRFGGQGELLTFFRRIIFDALAGNGDAHTKNWAFLFRDRRTATLAPVYDVVPTAVLMRDKTFAMPFTSEAAFHALDEARIRQFAGKLNQDPEELLRAARDTVERAIASFDAAMAESGWHEAGVRELQSHWQSLPLLRLRPG